MNDMLVSMGITFVLAAVKESFKNPERKEQLKKALLKVRNSISALYPEEDIS